MPSEGGAPWYDVRTEHFWIRTNVEREAAEAVGRSVEEIHTALLASPWIGGFAGEHVVRAILLREADVKTFSSSVIGYYSRDEDGEPLLVMSSTARAENVANVKHELTHYLMDQFAGYVPRWLGEGLAEYMETLGIDREKHTVVFGGAHSLHHLMHRRVPLADLMALREFPRWSARHYASSWLLVHYLIDREPERFFRYYTSFTRPEPLAFFEVFDALEFSDLERKLERFRLRGQYRRRVFAMREPSTEVRISPTKETDVHTALALLYLGTPNPKRSDAARAKLADEHLERALALDPNHVEARRLNGSGTVR